MVRTSAWFAPRALLVGALLSGCGEATTPSVPAANIAILPGAVAKGDNGFSPNPLTRDQSAGTRVTWLNGDFAGGTGTPHWLISDDGLFDSGSLDPQQSYTFNFPHPGTYGYHCKNHLTMKGTITILP